MAYTTYHTIENFYDRVRTLIGVSAENLSDEMIDYAENASLAEMIIKDKVPNWESFDSSKEVLFETAIIYQTAIQNISVAQRSKYKVKQTTSLKVEMAKDDTDLSQSLNDTLSILINKLNQDSFQYSNFSYFTTTN